MANPVRVRTAAGWQDLAIMGAQGAQGPAGATGPQGATGPMGPSGAAVWITGDTKIGMQAASHADPAGGMWLLADGSAIPGQYTALIALCGANLPDAKGRSLVMLGTHTDVDTIGKSDGIALASRRPKHSHAHSLTLPNHVHSYYAEGGGGVVTRPAGAVGNGGSTTLGTLNPSSLPAIPGTIGQAGMTDSEAYVVVGNLFVHT